jgi:hypothetical protein
MEGGTNDGGGTNVGRLLEISVPGQVLPVCLCVFVLFLSMFIGRRRIPRPCE